MKRAKFEKLLDRTGELSTLPVVATRILGTVRDEKSSARDVTAILELDPVISAKVLRLANSAYYRSPHAEPVADVHRATVVLGFMAIRNLVVATCLKSMYAREFSTNHFSARELWAHSVMSAVVCRVLARATRGADPEEAFLTGLLHDVGMIVEWTLFPELFTQVIARYQGTSTPFCEAEQITLGFDHAQAGAAILRRWEIPKLTRDAVAHHHRALRADEGVSLTAIVQAAERLCASRGNGFFDWVAVNHDLAGSLERLGLDGEARSQLHSDAADELERAQDLLRLD